MSVPTSKVISQWSSLRDIRQLYQSMRISYHFDPRASFVIFTNDNILASKRVSDDYQSQISRSPPKEILNKANTLQSRAVVKTRRLKDKKTKRLKD